MAHRSGPMCAIEISSKVASIYYDLQTTTNLKINALLINWDLCAEHRCLFK